MKEVLCAAVGTELSGGNVLVYSRSEGCAGLALWLLPSPLQCFGFGALGIFPGDGGNGMCYRRGVLLPGRAEA